MEFLIEYGLFLAKVTTMVAAILIIIIFLLANTARQGGREKGRIVIHRVNDKYEDMKELVELSVLDEQHLKSHEKEKKKEKKAQAKLKHKESEVRSRVYVLDFEGDVQASAADQLRQSITAVLMLATPKDEVVVRLESPGGVVHGYGLAASQLARITARNIPLTICVDKVAASGGYMMACVGHKILAAPFAVIGSIGVVAQLPNFHKILKKHDVDYEIFTAGEFKRTVTMLGENTEKGKQKFKDELDDAHHLFKEFIHQHRPVVDVDAVATGEVWFGKRALEIKLIDELMTSDDYLMSMYPQKEIVEVGYEFKKSIQDRLGLAAAKALEVSASKIMQKIMFPRV